MGYYNTPLRHRSTILLKHFITRSINVMLFIISNNIPVQYMFHTFPVLLNHMQLFYLISTLITALSQVSSWLCYRHNCYRSLFRIFTFLHRVITLIQSFPCIQALPQTFLVVLNILILPLRCILFYTCCRSINCTTHATRFVSDWPSARLHLLVLCLLSLHYPLF